MSRKLRGPLNKLTQHKMNDDVTGLREALPQLDRSSGTSKFGRHLVNSKILNYYHAVPL